VIDFWDIDLLQVFAQVYHAAIINENTTKFTIFLILKLLEKLHEAQLGHRAGNHLGGEISNLKHELVVDAHGNEMHIFASLLQRSKVGLHKPENT